jgi:hypothetical protein
MVWEIPHLQLIFAFPLTMRTIFAVEPANEPCAIAQRALPRAGAADLSVPLRDDD